MNKHRSNNDTIEAGRADALCTTCELTENLLTGVNWIIYCTIICDKEWSCGACLSKPQKVKFTWNGQD